MTAELRCSCAQLRNSFSRALCRATSVTSRFYKTTSDECHPTQPKLRGCAKHINPKRQWGRAASRATNHLPAILAGYREPGQQVQIPYRCSLVVFRSIDGLSIRSLGTSTHCGKVFNALCAYAPAIFGNWAFADLHRWRCASSPEGLTLVAKPCRSSSCRSSVLRVRCTAWNRHGACICRPGHFPNCNPQVSTDAPSSLG